MKPGLLRQGLGALACAAAATVASGAQPPAARWQCAPTASGAMAPALAEAAKDYLARVEALYPGQVLGLVRAGSRHYLLNARDIEWGERTRLALLALRLHDAGGTEILRAAVDAGIAPTERYERGAGVLTPERRARDATPGGEPPPGGFICLAASRAEREGLARTPGGEIVLAAGQSMHLVDPQEPQVAVEVRAAADRPLDLGEIFHRSARAGIYAGLTGHARQAAAETLRRPDGLVIFRLASAGRSTADAGVAALQGGGETAPAGQPSSRPAGDLVVAQAGAAPGNAQQAPRGGGVSARGERSLAIPAQRPAGPDATAQEPAPSVTSPSALAREGAAAQPVPPVGAAAPQPGVPLPPAPAEPAPARQAVVAVAPAPVEIPERPAPAPRVQVPAASPAQPAGQAAAQSYDDYARAMKTMMALKRPGSVRSVGEMTYVHPAVEVFRRQHP